MFAIDVVSALLLAMLFFIHTWFVWQHAYDSGYDAATIMAVRKIQEGEENDLDP